MGDTKITQVIQPSDRSIQGPFRRECAHMQFVNDGARERRSLETLICPAKCTLIVNAGECVDPIRLPLRSWVGIDGSILVNQKSIIRARARGLRLEACHQPSIIRAEQLERLHSNLHRNRLHLRSPDLESMHSLILFPGEQRHWKSPQQMLHAEPGRRPAPRR